jgi:hypothetical protein
VEQDPLGSVRSRYVHEPVDGDENGVHVVVEHDTARVVDMRVKGVTNEATPHQVDLDQSSRKRSLIRNGIIHSVRTHTKKFYYKRLC